MNTVIAGLDLSLKCSAAVCGTVAADGSVSDLDSEIWSGADGLYEMGRVHASSQIANGIAAWLSDRGVKVVWIEGYAFSRRSRATHVLAEHGGIVRARLGRAGIEFETAEQSHVRRWLLDGTKSSANIKDRIREAVRGCGVVGIIGPRGEVWTQDEYDACACLLWGAHTVAIARTG